MQVRLKNGVVTQNFKSDDTLSEVYAFVASNAGTNDFKLLQTFPRKILDDKSKTLKELGLVPSAALVMQ